MIQELPGDPLNYSLYLPSSGSGKLGKYMDDGLLLSNYALQGNIPKLEVGSPARHYSLIMFIVRVCRTHTGSFKSVIVMNPLLISLCHTLGIVLDTYNNMLYLQCYCIYSWTTTHIGGNLRPAICCGFGWGVS